MTLAQAVPLVRFRAAAMQQAVPVGTGAASGVLAQAEVAAKWGAGPSHVELVQGFLNGIISMIGSIVGGYGCVRLGGRLGYAVFGGIMAAIAANDAAATT